MGGIVDSYQSQYMTASAFDKNVICRIIVKTVKEQGGRFLKRGGEDLTAQSAFSEIHVPSSRCWVEVDDAVAISKVGHSFRTKSSSKKKLMEKGAIFPLDCSGQNKESGFDSKPRSDGRVDDPWVMDGSLSADLPKRLRLSSDI